jgi:hypothetical protein
MAQYIYEIKRNGKHEHISSVFPSLEAAYDHFTKQYAPEHYANIQFKRSHAISSSLVNKCTFIPKDDVIRVYFTKVESNPVPYGEWDDFCGKAAVADE